MADRDRDRDAPRRFRCSYCKEELVRGRYHKCPECIHCGTLLFPLGSTRTHRCEIMDEDERQISRTIEADIVCCGLLHNPVESLATPL